VQLADKFPIIDVRGRGLMCAVEFGGHDGSMTASPGVAAALTKAAGKRNMLLLVAGMLFISTLLELRLAAIHYLTMTCTQKGHGKSVGCGSRLHRGGWQAQHAAPPKWYDLAQFATVSLQCLSLQDRNVHRTASSCMAAVCTEDAGAKSKLMTGLCAALNASPRKLTCESAATSWPRQERHYAAERLSGACLHCEHAWPQKQSSLVPIYSAGSWLHCGLEHACARQSTGAALIHSAGSRLHDAECRAYEVARFAGARECVRFLPPLTVSEGEIAEALSIFGDCLEEVFGVSNLQAASA